MIRAYITGVRCIVYSL